MDLRAKGLRQGLARLLDDPGMNDVAKRLLSHPLMTAAAGKHGPSYIDPKVFAEALADIAKGSGGLEGQSVNRPIDALLRACGGDIEAFKTSAAQWFDSSMEQVAGIYKRRIHLVMLVVAFVVAFSCNIDSIQLTRAIVAMNPQQRASLLDEVYKAAEVIHSKDEEEKARKKAEEPSLAAKASLELARLGVDYLGNARVLVPYQPPTNGSELIQKILGWLITAMAASLGSQFWFKLLQDALRLTGRKPIGG